MKYKCLIFDCDGVLVDSEGITANVLVDMVRDLGITLDLEFVLHHFVGKSLNDIMVHLNNLSDEKLPPSFEGEYRRKTFEAFKTQLKAITGVHDLLKQLKLPFCTASSGPMNKIRHNLTVTGLIHFFGENIFSCYEIQVWKPQPDIFLHAAKTMGFLPRECAVIEDSTVGVEAALAGGFDVFVYTRDGNAPKLDSPKIKAFTAMEQLPNLLV
ncbi:MAG: HAD-IA family hydrolase [Bacteroidota bacterium]